MRPIYAALLLCLACSSSTHQQYADGAPLRPPAPRTTFTPPGTGLPEYWAPPAERGPDVQPNPRPKRYLPPTREPGIWASDDPKASDGRDPPGWNEPLPKIVVLDVEIPMPEEVRTRWDGELAVRCAYIVDLGLRSNHALVARLRGLGKSEKRCIAAAAFAYCTTSTGDKYREILNERERTAGLSPGDELARYRIDSVQNGARTAMALQCGSTVPAVASEYNPLFEAILRTKVPPRTMQ